MEIAFITGDIPALCLICQTKVGGYASCRKCDIWGERRGNEITRKDKNGKEVTYLENGRICFGYEDTISANLRTDADFRAKTQSEHHHKLPQSGALELRYDISPFEREFLFIILKY